MLVRVRPGAPIISMPYAPQSGDLQFPSSVSVAGYLPAPFGLNGEDVRRSLLRCIYFHHPPISKKAGVLLSTDSSGGSVIP